MTIDHRYENVSPLKIVHGNFFFRWHTTFSSTFVTFINFIFIFAFGTFYFQHSTYRSQDIKIGTESVCQFLLCVFTLSNQFPSKFVNMYVMKSSFPCPRLSALHASDCLSSPVPHSPLDIGTVLGVYDFQRCKILR